MEKYEYCKFVKAGIENGGCNLIMNLAPNYLFKIFKIKLRYMYYVVDKSNKIREKFS